MKHPTATPAEAYGPGDLVIFVSDVHIRYGDQAYLDQFTEFLERIRQRPVTAVYIHGDLFEFYVGPRQGSLAFYDPLFASLRALTGDGIPVGILHGNRDYLMGARFAEAGCAVLPDEMSLRLGSLKVHLSHGDQFCVHDRSYQFWARGVLRAAPVRFLVRNLPLRLALWLAHRYRKISARKFERAGPRPASRLPTVFDGVRQLLDRDPHDVVICGHIHDLNRTALDHPGGETVLYTTGAWEDGPNCIQWLDGELTLETAASGSGQVLGTP